MAKKKKGNPHSIPKSPGVYRYEGVVYAMVILCTVLLDKFGYGREEMEMLWNGMYKLKDELAEGRINYRDLKDVLVKEYKMEVE